MIYVIKRYALVHFFCYSATAQEENTILISITTTTAVVLYEIISIKFACLYKGGHDWKEFPLNHFSISTFISVFPLNHFSISTATNWTFNLIVAMTFLFLTQWLTRWIQELEKKTASYHQTQYSWVAEFSMITEYRIDTIGNCPGVEPSISTQVWPSLVGQPFS